MLVTLIGLLCVVFCTQLTGSPLREDTGYVYIWPADTTVYLRGPRLSVMVDSNITALHSFSVHITFDSSVIESNWDSILPGSIFPDTLFTLLLGDIYNGDSIVAELSIMGAGTYVNGPGEILSLWFNPKGCGTSSVHFAYSVLLDTLFPMGNLIPHYTLDGQITVTGDWIDETTSGNPSVWLGMCIPNPFRERTVISYQLPIIGDQSSKPITDHLSPITLKIYDLSGNLVRTLPITELIWDGRDEEGKRLQSGVYLLRLEAGRVCKTRKIVLVR